MPFSAKVILDSITPTGARLTTMEISYPRFILAEINTHRALSKNSSSSRAVPIDKFIERVNNDPAMPIAWGRNQSGMQANAVLTADEEAEARKDWLLGAREAVDAARRLQARGLHKQIVNRVLEPYLWMTTIVSATEWENLFTLRCHADAQPEFKHLAELMREARKQSTATVLQTGEWHLPYIQPEERETVALHTLLKLATARCARVSYLTHDGRRDLDADIRLYDRLRHGSDVGHYSPFEHSAQASASRGERSGNFIGWIQYRQLVEAEDRERAHSA